MVVLIAPAYLPSRENTARQPLLPSSEESTGSNDDWPYWQKHLMVFAIFAIGVFIMNPLLHFLGLASPEEEFIESNGILSSVDTTLYVNSGYLTGMVANFSHAIFHGTPTSHHLVPNMELATAAFVSGVPSASEASPIPTRQFSRLRGEKAVVDGNLAWHSPSAGSSASSTVAPALVDAHSNSSYFDTRTDHGSDIGPVRLAAAHLYANDGGPVSFTTSSNGDGDGGQSSAASSKWSQLTDVDQHELKHVGVTSAHDLEETPPINNFACFTWDESKFSCFVLTSLLITRTAIAHRRLRC